jgi:hypothetical protein
LRVGDILLRRAGHQVPITGLSARQTVENVYNFYVDEFQCYAVGASQILVHNNSGLVSVPVENPSVQPYQVGPVNELKNMSRPFDDLAIHHAGQQHPMSQIVPGYNPSTAPGVALPTLEHRAIPNLTGPYSGNARQLLAADIANLRNYTNAPNSSLLDLINLNREMYPGAFAK